MNEGLDYLQTFNPAESRADLLEQTLVGRKDIVDYLEELVMESATSGNLCQNLIIGPRGSGKTHLLRVLYNRVSTDPRLKDKLKIGYLCEDEYGIATFLDFVIRILRAFIKWDTRHSSYLEEEIDKLKKVTPHNQEKMAKQLLLNHIKGATLLIIVENLSNIFTGFKEIGQAKLRDFLQENPFFTIVASNQALFREIRDEDKPFHNFFSVTHLKRLNLEQAIEFLKSIAQWEKKTGLLKFLDDHEGKGRIHAIYDLTGGNHRLLVTFYSFLKADYKNNLSYSFIKTINDLIPYYQGFMNLLSAQQQKIIQYLCQSRKPANVKEIAENCFSAQNTISKQMSTLVKLKYVEGTPSGKETFYELAEPLLRICFEVKENRGGPVKLFIDFLGNLYSAQEIKKKYMQYHILGIVLKDKSAEDFGQEHIYYKEALKRYFREEFDRLKVDRFEGAEKTEKVDAYLNELARIGAYKEISEFADMLPKGGHISMPPPVPYGETDLTEKIELLERAVKDLENALEIIKESNLHHLIPLVLNLNLFHSFKHETRENIAKHLRDLVTLTVRNNYNHQFREALSLTIFDMLIRHDIVEVARFQWVEEALKDVFKDEPVMVFPLKFLDIGIRHLKKKEKNVLMELTKEERNVFKEFVLDKIAAQ